LKLHIHNALADGSPSKVPAETKEIPFKVRCFESEGTTVPAEISSVPITTTDKCTKKKGTCFSIPACPVGMGDKIGYCDNENNPCCYKVNKCEGTFNGKVRTCADNCDGVLNELVTGIFTDCTGTKVCCIKK